MGSPLVSDEDGVRTITLDRPEVLNALTLEDLNAIREAVVDVNPTVRGLVLTGAGGRAFSAGMHVDTSGTRAPAPDGRSSSASPSASPRSASRRSRRSR